MRCLFGYLQNKAYIVQDKRKNRMNMGKFINLFTDLGFKSTNCYHQ